MDRSAEKTLRILREASVGGTTSTDRNLEIVEGSLSADERLAVYEKVADDEGAARELRMLVARKANLLRITARLQMRKTTNGLQHVEIRDRERASLDDREVADLLFSPMRMAGNARERANDVCKKLMQTRKQPVGVIDTLKSFVADRRSLVAKRN